ncbi:MAG: hypothetical protein HC892_00155 [Saprospiraceae bacterium]|nr:hypothetical protein [Saprospiraceae bacterium]
MMRVVEWIKENDPGATKSPPQATLPYSQIISETGASKGTVHNAWTYIKGE